MKLQINVSDKTGKTTKLEVEDASALLGLKIGDSFKGELIGKSGYEFVITGGSDNAGFPMRRDVIGEGRHKVLLSGGVGFRPKRKGIRVRKTVAGNTVSEQTSQLNVVVIKQGSEPLVVQEQGEE